ncbi:hypothetical protein F4782DRAFT_968 [Xylaria castorea]|nr:hypothetical protein F4782DRAFT_968 [Xylaria castorea]
MIFIAVVNSTYSHQSHLISLAFVIVTILFIMLLTASHFLQLPKLEGFVLPFEIPFLHSGRHSSRGTPHTNVEGEREKSTVDRIKRLLSAAFIYHASWVHPLNVPRNATFWQRISQDSGIEDTTARSLLLCLLNARREYHGWRPRGPPPAVRINLDYWADFLCDHQEELFKKHGLVIPRVTATPQVTNVKRDLDGKGGETVAKKPRSSEYQTPQSKDSSLRPSDYLRELIKEVGDVKARIVDGKVRLTRKPRDSEERKQVIAELDGLKRNLENMEKHLREEHSNMIQRKRGFRALTHPERVIPDLEQFLKQETASPRDDVNARRSPPHDKID